MSTVSKAIRLLEAFDVNRPDLGLTALATLCDFDKATTRRLLLTLAQHGMIEQDSVSRRYRLGPALVRFAAMRGAHSPLTEAARRTLLALSEETVETAYLSEFAGGFLTATCVVEAGRADRIRILVGAQLPLHTTSSGLAYLAVSPESYVETYLEAQVISVTTRPQTNAQQLRQQLFETRSRGYSVGDDGHAAGAISVATAILDDHGHPIGTVAVASPSARIDDVSAKAQGAAVQGAARQISQRLYIQAPRPESGAVARNKDRAL